MATLPSNRTKLQTAVANQQPSIIAASQANRETLIEAYDTIDLLNQKVDSYIAAGVLVPYPLYFMLRQSLINGNMDVWQRLVTIQNPANNSFASDRWLISYFGAAGLPANINHIRLSLTPPELPGSNFAYRVGVDGGGPSPSADDSYGIYQRIENGTKFLCGLGKKVTVSFWARSNISGKRVGVVLHQRYGTGTNSPSGENILKGTIFNLTTDWQQFSFTFTTSTLQGKTFGNNNDDYLQIGLDYMWGSNAGFNLFNSSVIEWFRAAGNIDISQVQLSAGENVLPFQPKTFGDELAACQRYYEKSYDYISHPGDIINNGAVVMITTDNTGTGPAFGSVQYKTTKRAIPSIRVWGIAGHEGQVYDGSNDRVVDTGKVVDWVSDTNFRSEFTVAGATTPRRMFHWTADAEI